MKVEDPQGQVWRVTRRWTPWRWRRRDVDGDPLSNVDIDLDNPLGALVWFLIAVLVIPVVVVAVVAAVEALLLLLLIPLVVLGRVMLGRRWAVEARRGWTAWWEHEAGDWRASGELIREVATEIERGHPPERTLGRDREAPPDAPSQRRTRAPGRAR